MDTTLLLRLGHLYAAHLGISLSTAGRHVANHGAFFTRLESGHTITEARTARVARSLSHRWPADLSWPVEIPRPTPAPYTPLWRRAAHVPPGAGHPDPRPAEGAAGGQRAHALPPDSVPGPDHSGLTESPDPATVPDGGPA